MDSGKLNLPAQPPSFMSGLESVGGVEGRNFDYYDDGDEYQQETDDYAEGNHTMDGYAGEEAPLSEGFGEGITASSSSTRPSSSEPRFHISSTGNAYITGLNTSQAYTGLTQTGQTTYARYYPSERSVYPLMPQEPLASGPYFGPRIMAENYASRGDSSSWLGVGNTGYPDMGQPASQANRRRPEYPLTGYEMDDIARGGRKSVDHSQTPSDPSFSRSAQVSTGSHIASGSYIPARPALRHTRPASNTQQGHSPKDAWQTCSPTDSEDTSEGSFESLFENVAAFEIAREEQRRRTRQKSDFPYQDDKKVRWWVKRIYYAIKNTNEIADGPVGVKTFRNMNVDEECIQKCCWDILLKTRNAQEEGRQSAEHLVQKKHLEYDTFSSRMEAVIKVLQTSKAACKTLFDSPFLNRLVDNPEAELKMKRNNRVLNIKKTIQNQAGQKAIKKGVISDTGEWMGEGDQAEQATPVEEESEVVAAEKRPRRRRRKAAPEEEEGEEEEREEKNRPRPKRRRRGQ